MIGSVRLGGGEARDDSAHPQFVGCISALQIPPACPRMPVRWLELASDRALLEVVEGLPGGSASLHGWVGLEGVCCSSLPKGDVRGRRQQTACPRVFISSPGAWPLPATVHEE